jgi:EpsG family
MNGLLSLINPFLGFFSSLLDILRLRNSCLYFAFSLALIAIYFPIMPDTASNFYKAYYSLNSSYGLSILEPYIFIPSYFMRNFGVDFYYFIFFNVFFIIYVWSKIIVLVFSKSEIKHSIFFVAIFLLLTFNYRDLMDINRSFLAYSFIFYYIFLVKQKNFLKLALLFSLSVLFHSSSLIIIVFYFISQLNLNYRYNVILLFLSILIGLFLPSLISSVEGLVSKIPLLGGQISYYIYGETYGVQVFSTGTLLKKTLNCVIVFFACFMGIISLKKNGHDKILQFMVYLGCFLLFFSSFVTFFERMNLAFNFLIIYLFYKNISQFGKYFLTFLVFFRSFCVYLLIYFPIFFIDHSDVMSKEENKTEMILKPVIYFTPFLLDIHDNGYSDNFIINNVIWGR